MQTVLSLITSLPYIELPYTIVGWLGWIGMVVALGFGVWYWREPRQVRNTQWWLLFAGFAAAVPFTTLFIGIRMPAGAATPIPNLPVESSVPVMMFLLAIPYVMAAGILGPAAGLTVGLLTGLFLAMFETHSLFTPLEIGGLALLFSVTVRQRYRTVFYQLLRHPLFAGIFLSICYAPVYIYTAFFSTNGSLAVRLDFALTQTWMWMVLNGLMLILACVFAEVLFLAGLPVWGRKDKLQPSPAESNLQVRFFYGVAPWVLLLILTLTISDWVVAGNAAQKMIRDRLSSTSSVAAQSLPYFLETGQNLILEMANPELTTLSPAAVPEALATRLRSVPYFRQLYLLEGTGDPAGGYPSNDFSQLQLTDEEKAGIRLATQGVPIQVYTIPPLPGENTVQVSFLAAVHNLQGQPDKVLLGRTDLNTNPFTQPAIKALEGVKDIDGEGVILDENQRILYHPISSLVMSLYKGKIPKEASFYNDQSPQGLHRLVYYQPVVGRPWSIILSVPAEQVQQIALNIAVPLLFMLCLLAIVAFISLRLGLRMVTSSLETLANEATLIAQGQLDHPLKVSGVDEVGRFARAFEQMRVSLKARLEELNRLLVVSQGVAANLEASKAVMPILQAALVDGACLAKVVLLREVSLDVQSDAPIAYGAGPALGVYDYLDGQIFETMRQQDMLSIVNLQRIRRFLIPQGAAQPGALMALSLRQENTYYGALWVAYDQPHTFSEEEVRFLSTLAGQAAMAASNAHLYASAEIGRQRLEAVLSSTPDPVLVIDQQNRLLLLNPAALQLAGLISSSIPGKPVREVIAQPELLQLVSTPVEDGMASREISLPNGRIYYASVSSVSAEGLPVGKICILRDITYYKELDTLKSDFVATVSHDLRSPLTLMRGYTTMLQMVGELNEQQKSYVGKIVIGIESMSRLVGNLLDLGRIEAGVGLQVENVSASSIVDGVVESLTPQANQKNITLRFEPSIEILPPTDIIQVDKALISQAVYNLVENAIKYTQVGGKVNIRMEWRPSTAVFQVKDTGIGIAPLDLPHMFEKFYRSGRREAYQQRGTGLGLAIVKSITERHGGKVWVESQLGKGSTFFMELPQKKDQLKSTKLPEVQTKDRTFP